MPIGSICIIIAKKIRDQGRAVTMVLSVQRVSICLSSTLMLYFQRGISVLLVRS